MTIQKLPGTAIVPGTVTVVQLESSVANTVQTGGGPKLTNIQITDNTYTVLDDTAVAVAGGYIKITGTGFVTGCSIIIGSLVATSVSFISATEVRAQIPAQSAGTYTVYLVNPDGGVGIRVNGLNYSATPTWSTTSPLPGGVKDTAISIQLVATSNSAVTFSLQSGSTLPTGLTLSSGGLLSGTVSSISVETTYNFTIIATDGENQDTPQAFQITISVGDLYYELVTLHLPGTGTNGAQNNTFLDGSTNNFTITRNGNTTQGTFSPFSQTGWSNYFNGSSFFSRAYDAAWNFGAGDFTVECWFNTTTTTAYKSLMSADGSGSAGWALLINNGGSAGDILFYEQNLPGIATTTSGYNDGKWHHVAVVRNGTSYRIYVDGAICSNNTTSATASTPGALYIGGSVVSSSRYMVGYISNARIVKGTAVYTAPFTPPATPLTAITNTQLLTCQSNRFVDNSANNFTFSITGTPSVQAFSPFNPTSSWSAATNGGSGYFDGSGDYLSIGDSTAFDLPGDFTIEFWVYPLNVSSSPSFCTLGSSSASNNGFLLYYSNGATSIRFYSNGASVAPGPAMTNNRWYHIAIVRSGSGSNNLVMFVDGVSVTSVTNTTSFTGVAGNGFCVGAEYTSSYNVLGEQYLSSLRLIKGTAVYTGNFTPPSLAPLTTAGSTSAAAYPSTTNVNTSFASSACSLLLNFTNAGIYDATSKNDLETVGDAQISNTTAKWGSTSIKFDGTGDSLITPASIVNSIGTGDFTIEFWCYPSNTAVAYRAIVASENYNSTAGGWSIYQNGTGIEIYLTGGALVTAASQLVASTWQHIALVRSGSASNNCKLYVNGTNVASATNTADWTGQRIFIGDNNYPGTDYFFNGYIQGLRITKGYARYTANFTPPTGPFPTL